MKDPISTILYCCAIFAFTHLAEGKKFYWRRKPISISSDAEANQLVKIGSVIVGRKLGRQQPVLSQLCPDNRQAVAGCIAGLCGAGFDCINNNLCCYGDNSLNFRARCIDGSSPLGVCTGVGSSCPESSTCTTSLICCRPFAPAVQQPGVAGVLFPGLTGNVCPFGGISGLPCLSGACPPGAWTCLNNFCCLNSVPAPSAESACPGGTLAQGLCQQGLCPVGYTCYGNYCCSLDGGGTDGNGGTNTLNFCPNGQIAGASCINGQCADGYYCSNGRICCQVNTQGLLCPTGVASTSACINGLCGIGYQCINGICCQTGQLVVVRPGPQPPFASNNLCPDGQPGVAACSNGQCNLGFQCTSNNICCPTTTINPNTAQQTITCPNGIVANAPCNYATNPQTGCVAGSACYDGACCPISTITNGFAG